MTIRISEQGTELLKNLKQDHKETLHALQILHKILMEIIRDKPEINRPETSKPIEHTVHS